MSAETFDISGDFHCTKGCRVFLPDDNGELTVGHESDGEVALGVRAFADHRMDEGPHLQLALMQNDGACLILLDLHRARHFVRTLNDALAAAEKLQ